MAASLTRRDVEDIALLARLELDDDELERLRGDLTIILDHVDALRAVDTSDVEPMTHAVPMDLRLREDTVAPSLSPADTLGRAPVRSDDYFQVPHVIKPQSGE